MTDVKRKRGRPKHVGRGTIDTHIYLPASLYDSLQVECGVSMNVPDVILAILREREKNAAELRSLRSQQAYSVYCRFREYLALWNKVRKGLQACGIDPDDVVEKYEMECKVNNNE